MKALPILASLMIVQAAFADNEATVTTITNGITPTLGIDFRNDPPPFGSTVTVQGVTITENNPNFSWFPSTGIAVNNFADLTFSLSSGVDGMLISDQDVGGGSVSIFYGIDQNQNSVTVDQGNWLDGFKENLIQFNEAVNHITIKGATSVAGLHTNIPALPEPSNIYTVALLGTFLVGVCLHHLFSRRTKQLRQAR